MVRLKVLSTHMDKLHTSRGQSTVTAWLTQAGEQSTRLHHRTFQHLTFAHIQLDAPAHPPALPDTCPLAVAGDRSPQQAHPGTPARTPDSECRSCRDPHAAPAARPHLPPPLHQRWFKSLLLCTHSPIWSVGEGQGTTGTPLAGGSRADLWSGQEGLSAVPTGARNPADALWDSRRAANRPHQAGAERAAGYGLYRTREPDPTTKCFRFDPPQLVDSSACATAPGAS